MNTITVTLPRVFPRETYKALAAAAGFKTDPSRIKELQEIKRKLGRAMVELNRIAAERARWLDEKQTAKVERMIRDESVDELMPADFVSREQFRANLKSGIRAVKDGMRAIVGEAAEIARAEIREFQFAATAYVETLEKNEREKHVRFAIPYDHATHLCLSLRSAILHLPALVPPKGVTPYATPIDGMLPWLDL